MTGFAGAPRGGEARAPRVVVVGGGIAGLTAAREVLLRRPDAQVTLLEGTAAVGGKLRLGSVAGQPVDLGAESLLNRRPEAVGLVQAVGLGPDLVYPQTTSAGVWTRGAVRRLPPSVMGVPTDLRALAGSGIVGPRGLLRARADRLMAPIDVTGDVAVGELVARRVGREIVDRLVEPLLGGVYAGRADDLSLRATIPQLFRALSEKGRLLDAAAGLSSGPGGVSGSAVPVFAGIDGGVGRLAVAVAESVRALGGGVRTGALVRELGADASGFRLIVGPTTAAEVVEADAVIVAVPAAPAARLLRDTAPRAAAELSQVAYASMAIVTVAFDARSADGDLVGSGFLVPPVDGREIKAVTFSSRKWGWMSDDLLVVRCSIGRVGEEAHLQRDDSDLVEAAVLDLREATGLRGPLVGALVTRWGGALPQYGVGHPDRVERVRQAVGEVPGLAVCGAAYGGVGIPACVESGQAAATRVVEGLDARETMGS